MSVNAKMTAIADEIRELSGTTDAMGLDEMATHVGEANDEVSTQTSLIEQIVTALEGKATGGGSGSGGDGDDKPTFSVVNNLYHTIYVNGRECPPLGQKTSGIKYAANSYNTFLLIFGDSNDAADSLSAYVDIFDLDVDVGADHFIQAHSADFIYNYGAQTENCRISVSLTSTLGFEYHNIFGIILNPPWDYVNNTYVNGATITFEIN